MFLKKILSVDIGSHTIKMVLGKYLNHQVIIEEDALLPTPYNAICDGHILDLEKIKNTMNPFLKTHHLLKKRVVFSLESSSMIKREILLPYAKEKDFRKMLLYKIYEDFPINLDEYIVQYRKIEDIYEDGIKKARVLTAALPKEIVEVYLTLASQLNLVPLCLESHGSALLKLLHKNVKLNDQPIDNKSVLIIDLGDKSIHVNIFDHGIYQLSRLIKVREKSIKSSDEWINDLSRILEFHNSRKIGNKIDKIYAYGGYAHEEEICKMINDYFHMSINKIKKVTNIKNNKKDFDLSLHLNAVGGIIKS